MFKSIQQAFVWLVEGLVEVLDGIAAMRGGRAALRLVPADDAFAVEGLKKPLALRLTADAANPRLVPAAEAAGLKDRDVDIVRPAEELITRTLETLPADSRPYLDGIVRHHLERLVPWRAADVLYGYRVEDARDDRILVTIAATSRLFNAALIGALGAAGAGRLRLAFRGPDGADVAISVDGDAADGIRRAKFRRAATIALAALLLAGAGGGGYLAYAYTRASDNLVETEQAIADLRKQLASRGPQRPGQGRDMDALLAKRRSTPYASLVLNGIAEALPDDTYATELRIADGNLRVSGVSRNVAELVPLIEGYPAFAEANFFSPTTRLPDGQGDRFNLQMRLTPARGTSR